MDKIKILEDRISEVLDYIKVLQKEKAEVERKLRDKEMALEEAQHQIETHKRMEDEYNRMKEERGEVRSRVEKILDTLKGIGSVN